MVSKPKTKWMIITQPVEIIGMVLVNGTTAPAGWAIVNG